MRRDELLRKLIKSGHLNVIERGELNTGIIHFSEVEALIAEALRITSFFPECAHPLQPGMSVYEGAIIEKIRDDEFILHFQRGFATDPYTISEQCEKRYTNFHEVVEAYIVAEWRGNIDGISIVEG